MSLNSIRKQIERIGDEVEDYSGPGSRVFLVTDSKGRCLSRYLERRDFLDIVWESGARVGNEGLLGRLRRKIEGLPNPIVNSIRCRIMTSLAQSVGHMKY